MQRPALTAGGAGPGAGSAAGLATALEALAGGVRVGVDPVRACPVRGGREDPGTRANGARGPGGPGLLFFGGSRRSGTTWVSAMLNAHPRVECRNEGWVFNHRGNGLGTWIDEAKFRDWASYPEARGTWLKDVSVDSALTSMRRAMLLALYERAVVAEGWKTWENLAWAGEKTTMHLCTSAETVHGMFPDARFLHMLRDGRDVVVSDMFLLLKERSHHGLSARGVAHCEAVRAYYLRPDADPRGGPDLFCDDVLEYLAGEWALSVAGGARAAELYGPSFLQIRYERLRADTRAGVRAMLEWLGVESHDDMVEHLVNIGKFERHAGGRSPGQADPTSEWRKGVSGDWASYFTARDRAVFKSVAGSVLIETGYVEDRSW